MRQEDEGTYEMLWDCSRCDTPKLLGVTHRFCPNCGSPQDATRRYFPSEEEKVAVKDHVYFGADWVCSGCETPNHNRSAFCTSCGSPKDTSKDAKQRAEQVAANPAAFAADSAKNAQNEFDPKRAQAQKPPEPPKEGGGGGGGGLFKTLGCVAVAAVGALILVAVLLMFFWKKEAAVVVTGHSWERTIAVEQKKEVEERAWKDDLPSNARVTTCAKEQKDTKKVEDGEECNTKKVDQGDGTYKQVKECKPKYKEEPVYAEKCGYVVNKWVETRQAKAEGSALTPAPSWPDAGLRQTGDCVGCERAGAKKETYTLHFKDTSDAKKTYTCDVDATRWASFVDGSKWKGQASVITGALDCAALAPLK